MIVIPKLAVIDQALTYEKTTKKVELTRAGPARAEKITIYILI